MLHETGAAWACEQLICRVLRRIVLLFFRVQFAPARFLAGSCTPQHAMRPQPWRWPCFSASSRTVTHLPYARISRSRATCGLTYRATPKDSSIERDQVRVGHSMIPFVEDGASSPEIALASKRSGQAPSIPGRFRPLARAQSSASS